MSLKDDLKQDMKKYGGSTQADYFEFENPGVYKMRLLVQPKIIAYHFPPQGRPDTCVGIDEGCPHHGTDAKKPTIRLVTYIIDREDGKVKRAELPLSVSYAINDLQEDSDFAFEDFPMPYDVKITYDPKNPDPKAKYRLVASPKQEPLSQEEELLLSEALKKQTPEQYVEMKKKFQGNKGVSQLNSGNVSSEAQDIDPLDIPF